MQDITSLEQSLTGSSSSTTDIISSLLAWVILPSVIFMIVLTIALIINSVRRWRVEQAIFEIRDLLRQMNNPAPNLQDTPQHRSNLIAQTQESPSENPPSTA